MTNVTFDPSSAIARSLVCRLSTAAHVGLVRRRFKGMNNLILAFLLVAVASSTVRADTTQPATGLTQSVQSPVVAPSTTGLAQNARDAFALGYCLEYMRLHAGGFVASVTELKRVNDDNLAGDMVSSLITSGEALRRLEGDTLGRSATLIQKLGASQKAHDWAELNAAQLAHPIAIPPKRTDTPSKELTDHLAAIIDDTSRIQKELLDQIPTLTTSIQVSDGNEAVWSTDLGSYTAELSLWNGDTTFLKGLQASAKRLADGEPADVPADVDKALRSIVPSSPTLPTLQKGSGNLSALLPSHINEGTVAALRAAPGDLLDRYEAKDLSAALEDEHYSVVLTGGGQ
jgi:hypothetical protein